MKGQTLVLIFAGLALAWIVFFGAGVQAGDRNATLLFFGAISFFYWPFRGGQTAPPLKIWHAAALIALPCYLLFQVTSFPPGVLAILSPARTMLTDALAEVMPNVNRAPISVAPDAALFGLFGFLGYIAAFLLIRDLAWRFTDTYNWAPVFPLVAVGCIDALVGLFQAVATNPALAVRGTFPDRNHFCGFLEMILPLSVVCGYQSFRRHRSNQGESAKPALITCVMWGASVLFAVIIFWSASPASPLIVGASLLVVASLATFPLLKTANRRWVAAGILFAAVVVFLILVPPTDFADRLADLAAVDKSPAEQLALWKETLPLLSEFRWFGTGLGGFESTFLKYQGTMSSLRIQLARNDYLQYLVELGIIGFSIICIVVFGVIRSAVRGVLFLSDESRRLVSIAGIGCFVAVLLRSSVDSNLFVPANAIAFAWVAGIVSANGLE